MGNLETMLAAVYSGLPALLRRLFETGCAFEYQAGGFLPLDVARYHKAYEGQEQAQEGSVREKKERENKGALQAWAATWRARSSVPPERRAEETKAVLSMLKERVDRVINSKAFLAAAAHVSALVPKKAWTSDGYPVDAQDFDRKLLSHENVFTAAGLGLDPGNTVLALMQTLILMGVGLTPQLDEDAAEQVLGALPEGAREKELENRQRGDKASAKPIGAEPTVGAGPFDCGCDKHPLFCSAVEPGLGWRAKHKVPVTELRAPTTSKLRIVMASLASKEQSQILDLGSYVGPRACERLGDVLEAIGGALAPVTPAVESLRGQLGRAHDHKAKDYTEAMSALSSLATTTKDLLWLLTPPSVPYNARPGTLIQAVVVEAWWRVVPPTATVGTPRPAASAPSLTTGSSIALP